LYKYIVLQAEEALKIFNKIQKEATIKDLFKRIFLNLRMEEIVNLD